MSSEVKLGNADEPQSKTVASRWFGVKQTRLELHSLNKRLLSKEVCCFDSGPKHEGLAQKVNPGGLQISLIFAFTNKRRFLGIPGLFELLIFINAWK